MSIDEYWLNRFAHECLLLNLGAVVFGLRGIASLVPLIVVFVVALIGFVFLSRSHGSDVRGAR